MKNGSSQGFGKLSPAMELAEGRAKNRFSVKTLACALSVSALIAAIAALILLGSCAFGDSSGTTGVKSDGQTIGTVGADGQTGGQSGEGATTDAAAASPAEQQEGAQGGAKTEEPGDEGFILEDTSTVMVDIKDEEVG